MSGPLIKRDFQGLRTTDAFVMGWEVQYSGVREYQDSNEVWLPEALSRSANRRRFFLRSANRGNVS